MRSQEEAVAAVSLRASLQLAAEDRTRPQTGVATADLGNHSGHHRALTAARITTVTVPAGQKIQDRLTDPTDLVGLEVLRLGRRGTLAETISTMTHPTMPKNANASVASVKFATAGKSHRR